MCKTARSIHHGRKIHNDMYPGLQIRSENRQRFSTHDLIPQKYRMVVKRELETAAYAPQVCSDPSTYVNNTHTQSKSL